MHIYNSLYSNQLITGPICTTWSDNVTYISFKPILDSSWKLPNIGYIAIVLKRGRTRPPHAPGEATTCERPVVKTKASKCLGSVLRSCQMPIQSGFWRKKDSQNTVKVSRNSSRIFEADRTEQTGYFGPNMALSFRGCMLRRTSWPKLWHISMPGPARKTVNIINRHHVDNQKWP